MVIYHHFTWYVSRLLYKSQNIIMFGNISAEKISIWNLVSIPSRILVWMSINTLILMKMSI